MPKISVIVPVYNVEPYLHRCVDSILAQTFRDFEVILVDDGSPDNCGAICDEYAAKDKRVKVIHQKNGGLSAARNAGLDIAQGEYIAFVDSDDYIAADMYETLIHILEETSADVAQCEYQRIIEEKGEFDINKSECNEVLTYDAKEILSHFYPTYWRSFLGYVWRYLYKKSVFREIRFPVDRIYEDTAISIQILTNCNRVVTTSAKLYNYMIRNQSITGGALSEKRVADHLNEHIKICDSYKALNDNVQLYRAKEMLFSIYAMYRLTNRFQFSNIVDMRKINQKMLRYLPTMLFNPEICRMKKLSLLMLFLNEKVSLILFVKYFPEWIPQTLREKQVSNRE